MIQRHMINYKKRIKLSGQNQNRLIEITPKTLKNYMIKILKILKLQFMKERKTIIIE